MELKEKTVLVTGSTGFLGRHLINSLIKSKRTRVRGLIIPAQYGTKQFDGLPVEKVFGDITCIEDMRDATQGCDIVVHCAIGDPDITVKGSQNVMKAAAERQVKRFIHISSTAVFGYSPQFEEVIEGRLQGHHYKSNYFTDYARSKIASEKIAFSYYDSKKLPLVILRPSHIYGPWSMAWTVKPIEMLDKACYVLINGGLSPSNTVYVDDVVDAIELAIKEDNAVGHALTISNNQNSSWKDFFSSYMKMFSTQHALLDLTLEEIKIERARLHLELLKKIISQPNQILNLLPHLAVQSSFAGSIDSLIETMKIRKKISTFTPHRLKTRTHKAIVEINDNILTESKLPEIWLEKTFTMPFNFPIKEATKILGFKPRVSLEEGMEKTEKWLREYKGNVLAPFFTNFVIPQLDVSKDHRKMV